MLSHRRHLAAIACVLLLNLQLFAANALGCVHRPADAAASAGCAHWGVAAMPTVDRSAATPDLASAPDLESVPSPAPAPMSALALYPDLEPTPAAPTAQAAGTATGEPCQKCNLGQVAGAWHLVLARAPELAVRHTALPHAHPAVRIHAHIPDGLLRPPRSISG
ncbi:hypothetical protein [uncultured Thiohalocapsa sp.]|uniref:hypothetical protein n=1 Tax=uncultured Thiohalocapsa sp. TaxID=768990 RepID=UPI0025F056C3|nr:hypothetical protein [uncultured Thiohalocapsa sp.]